MFNFPGNVENLGLYMSVPLVVLKDIFYCEEFSLPQFHLDYAVLGIRELFYINYILLLLKFNDINLFKFISHFFYII